MVQPSDEIGRAINAIRNARLPHPDGELLERFIQDSADRKNAASFILQDTSEERLESFIKTWKATIRSFLTDPTADPTPFDNTLSAKITTKNSGTCCITGLQHSFWDPLVVTRILSWKSTRDHEVMIFLLNVYIVADLHHSHCTENPCDISWPRSSKMVTRSRQAATARQLLACKEIGRKGLFPRVL
jgi:hypothetical protein